METIGGILIGIGIMAVIVGGLLASVVYADGEAVNPGWGIVCIAGAAVGALGTYLRNGDLD